jgi:hypothetical protein
MQTERHTYKFANADELGQIYDSHIHGQSQQLEVGDIQNCQLRDHYVLFFALS